MKRIEPVLMGKPIKLTFSLIFSILFMISCNSSQESEPKKTMKPLRNYEIAFYLFAPEILDLSAQPARVDVEEIEALIEDLKSASDANESQYKTYLSLYSEILPFETLVASKKKNWLAQLQRVKEKIIP